MENYFSMLNAVNVNEHTEKKNNLTYLSWAWAWGEIKKRFPEAVYTIYESETGCFYHTDGRTAWVKTGVTVNGIECIEYLPVMDYKNRSIPLDAITSFDVNKAIQRSLTKACARHGLGLYIYAGEDLPEDEQESGENAKPLQPKAEDPPCPANMVSSIRTMIEQLGGNELDLIVWVGNTYGRDLTSLDELTVTEAKKITEMLGEKMKKQVKK